MKIRKVGWFLKVELKIKEIGGRNSVSSRIFKFGHLANARSFSDRARKPMLVILGDDELFWVVSLALGDELVKAGYEIVK
jgi:hypothetical protein